MISVNVNCSRSVSCFMTALILKIEESSRNSVYFEFIVHNQHVIMSVCNDIKIASIRDLKANNKGLTGTSYNFLPSCTSDSNPVRGLTSLACSHPNSHPAMKIKRELANKINRIASNYKWYIHMLITRSNPERRCSEIIS